jgi:hypothetical protein
MKIAFTLLSSLIFISAAIAGDKSRLTINVAGKTEYEIVVDNKRYTSTDNSLLLTDLEPGYHTIKVYRIRGGRGSSVKPGDRNELVNSTTILVKSGYHVDVIINRFGKALVDEEAMIVLQKPVSNTSYDASMVIKNEFRNFLSYAQRINIPV